MNTHRFSLLLLGMITLVSCRDITVKTKINKDGSFTRTITVVGDSSYAFTRSDLPYPVDDSWKMEVQRDSADQKEYTVTYTRSYRNDDELNDEMLRDTSWMKDLNREVTITRRFGFFNSYIRFMQRIKTPLILDYLDYRDYLTRDDLLYIANLKALDTPEDSTRQGEAEDKASGFIVNSLAAEAEAVLKDGIKRINEPGLDPSEVDRYHDSIVSAISDWDFGLSDDVGRYDKLIDYYSAWTGNENVNRLKEIDPPLFKQFQEKIITLAKIVMMESYVQVVEMPGLITETNSISLKGNQVSWDFNPMPVMFEGYEMYVESRIINTWAYVISGLVILAMIVFILIKALK